jgi:hypothetical protein
MLPMRDCGVHGKPSGCNLGLAPPKVLRCRSISLEAFRPRGAAWLSSPLPTPGVVSLGTGTGFQRG